MVSKKIILGFILIVLTATTITIMLQEQVKIKVTGTSSTFYVFENNAWISSGVEYNKLYNGSKLLSTSVIRTINMTISGNKTTITRSASYPSGTVIKDTYIFDGSVSDKERFPIKHTVEVINGTGLIYEYYVSGLDYQGPTTNINGNAMSFGHNMKIEFDPGYISAKVYQSRYIRVRYAINSSDAFYNVRLFDPIALYLDGTAGARSYEIGTVANITCVNAGSYCNITINSSNCVGSCYNITGSGQVNFTTYANQFKFNDGNPWKYFSANGVGYIDLNKYANLLDGATLNINWTTLSTCTQETANLSTDCGGVSTGTYTCSGTWHASWPCSNVFDENWGTYGAYNPSFAYLLINYTKPSKAFGAIWYVRDSSYRDLQLPETCWNAYATNISLNLTIKPADGVYWYCWNGTIWVYLASAPVAGAYEEAVKWNMTSIATIDLGDDGSADLNISGFSAGTQYNTNITNAGAYENLTMTQQQKVTRYIDLFKYVNYTIANMTVTGYINRSYKDVEAFYNCSGELTTCPSVADENSETYNSVSQGSNVYPPSCTPPSIFSKEWAVYENYSVATPTQLVIARFKLYEIACYGGWGGGPATAAAYIYAWNGTTWKYQWHDIRSIASPGCNTTTAMPNITLDNRTQYFNDNTVKLKVIMNTSLNCGVSPASSAETRYYETKIDYDDYPSISVDLLNDGIEDYGNSALNNTVQFEFNKTMLNNYMASTDCNSTRQNCVVPLSIYSTYGGVIKYSNINLAGVYKPIPFNMTAIQNYLDSDPFRNIYTGRVFEDQHVDIAIDTNNRVHYLYMNESGSPSQILYGNNTADVNTFTEMQIMSGDDAEEDTVRFALNGTNYARAIYMNQSSYGLRFLQFNGASWTNTHIKTISTSSADISSLLINPSNDEAYFAFSGYAPTYATWFAFKNSSGWNFEQINSTAAYGCIDITKNASGTFFFVYRINSPDGLWMARRNSASSYSFFKVTDNISQACKIETLNNKPSIATVYGAVAGTYYLYFDTWNGTAFEYEYVDSASIYEISMANDSVGTPRILYSKEIGGQPYYYYAYKSKGTWHKYAVNNSVVTVAADVETDYSNKTYGAFAQYSPSGYKFSIGVKNSNDAVTVPIRVNATAWGNFNITSVSIPFDGRITYNVTATASGSGVSYMMDIFWSNWTYSFPTNYNFIEFIPTTPQSKNVTPSGQTTAKPMLNISLGEPTDYASFYFMLNDTAGLTSCINTTVSNSSTKTSGIFIQNGTWYEFADNKTAGYGFGLWFWADYNCSYSTWKMFQPEYYFRACCEGCVCSTEAY